MRSGFGRSVRRRCRATPRPGRCGSGAGTSPRRMRLPVSMMSAPALRATSVATANCRALARVEGLWEYPTTFAPPKERKTANEIEPPRRPKPTTVICPKSFTVNELRKYTSEWILLKNTVRACGCQFFSSIWVIKMLVFERSERFRLNGRIFS